MKNFKILALWGLLLLISVGSEQAPDISQLEGKKWYLKTCEGESRNQDGILFCDTMAFSSNKAMTEHQWRFQKRDQNNYYLFCFDEKAIGGFPCKLDRDELNIQGANRTAFKIAYLSQDSLVLKVPTPLN